MSEPRKLNFDSQAIDLDGQPIPIEKNGVRVPGTWADFLINALAINFPGDTGLVKADKWRLVQKIHRGGEKAYPTKEVEIIQKAVDQAYGPILRGLIFDLIDPPATSEE